MLGAPLDESRDFRIVYGRVAKSALVALMVLPAGCASVNLLTDNCTAESILVSWPATITRGNTTSNVTLTGAVSPGNLDAARFNALRALLITGGAATSASGRSAHGRS